MSLFKPNIFSENFDFILQFISLKIDNNLNLNAKQSLKYDLNLYKKTKKLKGISDDLKATNIGIPFCHSF